MFKLRRGASSVGPASVAAVLAPPAYADVLAAFVTLGGADSGEPFALARVIVYRTGAHCPALKPIGGRAEQPMTSRCNPDPTHFDVTVCEAGYPTEGSRLKVSGAEGRGRRPAPARRPGRGLPVGDFRRHRLQPEASNWSPTRQALALR